jgi:RNA polymerase sigma factor (sigma-70 family)
MRLALGGDERLAQLVAGGSERAFVALYERYHGQLYRYCRSIVCNDTDAQDALQSTLTGAFTALRRGQRDAPLRPWLFRIAYNESVSVLRHRRPEERLSECFTDVAGSTEERVEQRERLSLLVADLHELPERQRGALVMRELNGLSHEQIAIVLRTSVGAVKQTIFEARRTLLEFAEGRTMACAELQRTISDADGRVLRGRRVRAHLRDCPSCATFAAAISARRTALQAVAPPLPAIVASELLARVLAAGVAGPTAAGAAATGGAAVAAAIAGTAGKTAATVLAAKGLAGAAIVATATVGTATVLTHTARHPARSSQRPPAGVIHGARVTSGALATRLARRPAAVAGDAPDHRGGSAGAGHAGQNAGRPIAGGDPGSQHAASPNTDAPSGGVSPGVGPPAGRPVAAGHGSKGVGPPAAAGGGAAKGGGRPAGLPAAAGGVAKKGGGPPAAAGGGGAKGGGRPAAAAGGVAKKGGGPPAAAGGGAGRSPARAGGAGQPATPPAAPGSAPQGAGPPAAAGGAPSRGGGPPATPGSASQGAGPPVAPGSNASHGPADPASSGPGGASHGGAHPAEPSTAPAHGASQHPAKAPR